MKKILLLGQLALSVKTYPYLWLPFLVYLWIFPWSIGLVALNKVPPGTEWMASVLLVLGGLVGAVWLAVNFGTVRAGLASAAILAGSWLLEAVGVTTGLPFGRYSYTEQLILKIGPVPLGIPFAWLMIVLAAYFTTQLCWPKAGRILWVPVGAALALLSDLIMEPVAAGVLDYWGWQAQGPYYNVPLANFAAWYLAALVLMALLSFITSSGLTTLLTGLRLPFFPLALIFMNLTMFTVINLARGQLLAGVLGLIGGGLLAVQARRVKIKNLILAI